MQPARIRFYRRAIADVSPVLRQASAPADEPHRPTLTMDASAAPYDATIAALALS